MNWLASSNAKVLPMSDFDEFVEEEDGGTRTKHQPKTSKEQAKGYEESHQTSEPSKAALQEVETDTAQDQDDKIADSRPPSWDREQFAMFFKESEVFDYEDQMHDAKGHLKHEYNVRNDKRYEIDQAFIELALERVDPEEVAVRLIESRGFEP